MDTDLELRHHLELSQNPAATYVARLAQGSRRAMRASLDLIAGILSPGADALALAWGHVRYQHTAAVRTVLADRYAPASVGRHLSALRGALREAWRLGQMTAEDYHRAIDIEPVKGFTLPAGRALAGGELAAMLTTCGTDARGLRDAAILGVLYGAGLRRSEVAALDAEDYDATTGQLTVHRGKGRRDRTTYVANGSKTRLDRWLAMRGTHGGALFNPVLPRTGRVVSRRLTDQAVYDVVRRMVERSGIPSATPHDLRRTTISDLIDAGADLSAVRDLAGHVHVQTTLRYDRRGERAKIKAAALLDLPV